MTARKKLFDVGGWGRNRFIVGFGVSDKSRRRHRRAMLQRLRLSYRLLRRQCLRQVLPELQFVMRFEFLMGLVVADNSPDDRRHRGDGTKGLSGLVMVMPSRQNYSQSKLPARILLTM